MITDWPPDVTRQTMTTVNTAQSNMTISGGMCLLPCQGLVAADLHLSGGMIAEIAAPTPRHGFDFDARNCLVLPGIVDIHGDAFERQIMPRPGTLFPLDIAMLDTDRQLASNGITTAYHGVTVSWEPGLRSLDEAQRIVTCLSELQNRFSVDNRLHIRWETFARRRTTRRDINSAICKNPHSRFQRSHNGVVAAYTQ